MRSVKAHARALLHEPSLARQGEPVTQAVAFVVASNERAKSKQEAGN